MMNETERDPIPEDESAGTQTETDPAGALPESDPVAELQAEADKWKDLALRTAADLDNLRKRTAREKDEARQFANARLLERLLPIVDNFEWGLQAARAESESSTIYQGMSMVLRQLDDLLASESVEAIDATGQAFDPNVHEAMGQQPSDEVPEGHVISQSRRGYRLRERLLRPAAVIVSSGPSDA